MKIELAKEHSSWCISCYQNYANYAIRMGMEPDVPGHVTSWKLFLCDPCLKEIKAIEYPPKPRYEIERYDLNVWPSCHPPKALTIENRAWGIKEHNKGYTATQAHFCKSCAEKVAKVLNEGQS